jgi:hypothetical protein
MLESLRARLAGLNRESSNEDIISADILTVFRPFGAEFPGRSGPSGAAVAIAGTFIATLVGRIVAQLTL